MNLSVSRKSGAALKPLALVSALSALVVSPAFGQSGESKSLAPVVVTASRFASDPAQSPIGATVITAEEIRDAGINNVNEAVRKLGGVYGRQSFSGTQDFSLDLRGFGTNSDQNLVVLVDGIRLSDPGLTPALLSSVPIESVERVEIVRGGSSVLYGEGATGGTVNIITKRGAQSGTRGTIVAEAGSFGHRELRASAAMGRDGFLFDANVGTQRADNYRDNNDVKQKNFSGGTQWSSNAGRIGLRIDVARQDSRFPGDITLDEFRDDPRQTNTPNDFGSVDTERYSLFVERHLGALDVAAELAHRERESVFDSPFYESRMRSRMTQFSPRIRHISESAGIKNELVAGLDFIRWSGNTESAFSDEDASQKSRALYLRDEIHVGKARIAAGARHEVFDKDFTNPLNYATKTYSKSHSLNAWELQAKYEFLPGVSAFTKGGRSYRVANVDENRATPVVNQPLEPQTSHDIELGVALGNLANKLTARVFRHRLTNEIFYNPIQFANVNLDPTERKGVEIEGNVRLMSEFSLSGTLQHVSAKFRDGPNDGNEMVLVPRNTATLRLNWLPGTTQTAHVGLQWVDTQRYGGDFANSCSARIPSFTTVDARYAKRFGAWEFAVSGTNLTDRDYFTNAYGDCQYGIYPDAGRQLKLSARMDF